MTTKIILGLVAVAVLALSGGGVYLASASPKATADAAPCCQSGAACCDPASDCCATQSCCGSGSACCYPGAACCEAQAANKTAKATDGECERECCKGKVK